jgi:hypothetical protein
MLGTLEQDGSTTFTATITLITDECEHLKPKKGGQKSMQVVISKK